MIDGHDLAARSAQAHGEDGVGRSGVALRDGRVVDGQPRQGVVVDDRPQPLAIADDSPGDAGDVHRERLVRLIQRIAVYQHGEGVGTGPRRDGLTGQGVGDIVGSRECGGVGSRDVEGHAAGSSRLRQADREGGVGRTARAFPQRDVIDRQRRQVVVQHGARRRRRRAHRVSGARREGQNDRLVRLYGGIRCWIDRHCAGCRPGTDGDGACHRSVIRPGGRSPTDVERDVQRRWGRIAECDGVNEIGCSILGNRRRGHGDRGGDHVVVLDRSGGHSGRPHRIAGARRNGQGHRFIGLCDRVSGWIDGDRGRQCSARDDDAGHRPGVVCAGGRRAGWRQVDGRRACERDAARHGEHQIGRAIFGDGRRRHRYRYGRRRRRHNDRRRFKLEILPRPRAAVRDPKVGGCASRRCRGAADDPTRRHRQARRQRRPDFQQVGIGRNPSDDRKLERGWDALDDCIGRRRHRDHRVLNGAGVTLGCDVSDRIRRSDAECVAPALGGSPADHSVGET